MKLKKNKNYDKSVQKYKNNRKFLRIILKVQYYKKSVMKLLKWLIFLMIVLCLNKKRKKTKLLWIGTKIRKKIESS